METNDWQIKLHQVNLRGEHLLKTSLWSDCTFRVGIEPFQEEVRGHKLFLAMASPVFEAMFFGGIAEKQSAIPILDVQPDAFKALLEYIYTDKIKLSSFDQACELCYAAKKYMLPYLVQHCTNELFKDITARNACRALEFARLFEEPHLINKCLEVIRWETILVLSEISFEEIEVATLATILEQDELSIDSELQLFRAVERWAEKECARKGLSLDDPKSIRSVTSTLIPLIRFLTMKPAEFAEGPAQSKLLTQDESFALLLHISSTSTPSIPLPEGFSTNVRARQKFPLARLSPGPPPKSDTPTEISNSPSTSVEVSSIAFHITGDNNKMYCIRNIQQQPHSLNSSILDCAVSFTVDRNICVVGIQIPTQVLTDHRSNMSDSYTELLYAHLLDSEGSRLTYTHFTSRVSYGTLIEISFNRPVYIQRHKVYRVGVVLNKMGWYPMGSSSTRVQGDMEFFNFCVGQPDDSIRDGLIRSIIFQM